MLALLLSAGLTDADLAVQPAAMNVQPSAPRQLTARQLLALAKRAQEIGEREVAESAYAALSKDPNGEVRAIALFGHAMLLSKNGETTRAATLLRQLISERPDAMRARLELAGILVQIGDEAAAARELRAVRAGKLPPDVARLVDRWSEALRARKPWGFSVEMALAPDSNINRATRADGLNTVLGEFEIDESGKARSGVGMSLRTKGYRRVRLSEELNMLAQVTTSADIYRENDFNLINVEGSMGPEFALAGIQLYVEAAVGASWYGGKPLATSLRAMASARASVGPRTMLSGKAVITRVNHKANSLLDGHNGTLTLSVEQALSPESGVVASGTVDRYRAKAPGYSTKGWRLGLQGWYDLGRTTVFGGVDVGRLEGDERLSLLPDAREDRFTRLSLGALMRSLSFAGLAPFVRVSRERNMSNTAFYDYSRIRTEFGFNRAF